MSPPMKLTRPTEQVGAWIGEIPASWGFGLLKRFCSVTLGKMIPQVGDSDAPSGSPYLRAAHVQPLGRLWLEDIKLMQFSQAEACRLTLAKGDVVVVEGGAGYGRAAFLKNDLEGWGFQNSINRVRTSASGDGRYVNYLFSGIQGAGVFETLINTSTIPHLTAEKLEVVAVPWPPIDEQRQIAEYLDRETGKIDELIAKQEQLVATLTERVTALWASRIDLLRAHHPTVSLRRVISSIVDGPFGSSLTSAHYSNEGARVIRLGNIGIFTFRDADEAYIPLEYARELSAHAVLAGDVVVAGLGDDKMPLGRAAVVPEALGIALVKADCYRVRPNEQVSAEYLAWALSSPQLRDQFKVLSRGSTRQRLNTAVVREATIPLPPRFEQDHAVEQFTRESVRTGQVVLKASKVVETLRERRSALISAAVTGKIDVRGL